MTKKELDNTSDNKPKRDSKGRLLPGHTANPNGTPKLTKEEKKKKKVEREIIKDYVKKLTEALPKISPKLIKLAKDGDIRAIKEIHDRVMGRAKESVDITSKGKVIKGFNYLEPDNKKEK